MLLFFAEGLHFSALVINKYLFHLVGTSPQTRLYSAGYVDVSFAWVIALHYDSSLLNHVHLQHHTD